ncbi:histone deacetylase 2 isoform X3 [Typha latifolia]|uniref:histone deacetylase 2 isoform X3 n=1 Tax=Typha latifolia TaxID=4733 RepID=UPI003C2D29DE
MSSASSSAPLPKSQETGGVSLRRSRILSSKLYFDVPLPKVPVIYSSSYDIAFFGIEKMHPFDSSKWGRICQFLIKESVLDKNRLVEPLEASRDDLLVVHSESYLSSLRRSLTVSIIMEVPPVALLPNWLVQQKALYPFRKQVGGSILAAKLAIERGWAINVGGGFHHCSAEKGGGFCVYADISLCIHFAFVRLNMSRVMIIDLDAHQGNGHETDFANDGRVYILDMYNAGIYPFVAKSNFDPELIVYNAGTDILEGDPLGRLRVSPDGVTVRDEKVFRFAKERSTPLLMLTSVNEIQFSHILTLLGGYMKSSARVIADSIINLSKKNLISLDSPLSRK